MEKTETKGLWGEMIPCPQDIIFKIDDGTEMLKLCANGDFLVKGKKIKRDIEVYKAMKDFLGSGNPLKNKRQGLITSVTELRKLADELEKQNEELSRDLKHKITNDSFMMAIINKEGLSDTWRFEQ